MNAPVSSWAWLCVFLFCLRLHAQSPSTPSDSRPVANPLTSTLAVQQLAPNEAARQHPVKIRGVVTFSQEWWRLLFVQDDTGGIFCEPAGLVTFPPAGHLVEVEGSSTPGAYLPVILVKKVTDLGTGQLPSGKPASAAQLWNGEFDGDLVQVSGYVSAAVTQNIPTPFLDLRLISAGRTIGATVLGISNLPPASLLGSHVELRGVFGPKMNDQKKISGLGLLSAQPGMLRILSDANNIARALPLRTISDLRHSTNQLLRARGTVALGGTNEFWLADERGGINVRLSTPQTINRGEELELLAIQNAEDREPQLSLLQILASRPGIIPPAEKIPPENLFDPRRHGQIVQTTGEFLHRVPSYYGDILVFRDGERSFEARLRFPAESSIQMLAAGTRMRLTGVLRMQTADVGLDASPRLLIHDPTDLRIVTAAPLSAERLSFIAIALAALLGAGLLALGIAHRRLRDSARRIESTERDLRDLNADLEHRITARTQELDLINSQLSREITERRHTEQTLAENERRFRLLVEQVDTIVWEFDPTLNQLLYVSPQAARLGHPLEDWLKPGFWNSHIHPDDQDYAVHFCVSETTKGLNHELQYRFLKADGTHVWLDDKVAVETRPDGSRLLRGIFIDITAQKEREQALRESEERFARAFHASPAISAITSFPDGIMLDANERLLQATGYTRDEVLGHTSLELGLWSDPEVRKKIVTQLEHGTSAREVEYEIINRHGNRRTLLGSLERIVLGGRQCILSINQDITDRKLAENSLKESEERFTKAFHASPAIIVITREADSRYIDVNAHFTRVLGFRREEAVGRTALDLGIWPRPEKRREILDGVQRDGFIHNVECTIRNKNGAQLTMLLSVERIILAGEACLLWINIDITERKRAESLRTEQNRILEMIAQGAPLAGTLERLALAIEAQAEGMLCSILLLSPDGRHLRHGAAPSLPDEYNRQVDGYAIGPDAASCGTAAYFGETVIVEDVLSDPRWSAVKHLAAPHGLRSCWSTPIFDSQHRLLGTFAMYYKQPARPSEEQLRLLQSATHTAAVCIRRARDEETLQESQRALRKQNDLLNEMEQLAEIGAWSLDLKDNTLVWSDEVYRIHELPPGEKPVVAKAISHYAPRARPVIAAAVEEAARSGRSWDLELPFITARGNRRWVRAQGKAELLNGRPVRLYGAFQDITHRKQTEDALRLSEERFAKAFQLSPAITIITRRSDGHYIDVNARFTEIMGYTRDEVLGKTSLELGLWASLEKRDEVLKQVEQNGCARNVESEYVDKSGRVHIMITSVEPIVIAGEPCLLSVNHDISDRRRIENGLRALVTCINAASSADFYFKLAQQLAKLFQTRYAVVAELIPGRDHWVRTLGISAGGEPLPNIEKALAQTPCGDAILERLVFIPDRVQERYPGDSFLAAMHVESYLAISILDSHRNPLGLLAVMHDQPRNPPPEYETILQLFAESAGVQMERSRSFAALQSAESRFRMAIEHSFDCLALTNAEGICTYISPAVTRILGYPAEELTGQPASNLVLPEDLSTYESHRSYLTKNAGAHAELEFRVRHRNGGTRWIQSADTNRIDDPDLKAIVSNFRDITERKHAEIIQGKLEVQLRQSQKMEAIGTLAGGVAHDFNNILGAIIGCAELARMDSINNPSALASLDDLLKASHRAKDLVKQILTFSRREEYQRQIIPLEPLVAESVRLLRAALPSTIELRTSVVTPLSDVLADPTLLQQVIMNLVTNAAQAIGPRQGHVGIAVRMHTEPAAPESLRTAAAGHSQVMIQVRDNGCGMEASVMERIFEPFFTTKGPGQGTGLGLSVVHGIISAHGGIIRVESSPGKGSAFTILLPAAWATRGPAREPVRPAGLAGGTERILLVDDEKPLLIVCEKVLRRAGYRVTGCTDATAALEIFQQAPDDFDLVITDYSMPGQSGADLARAMFAVRPRLPLIVCTGYTTGLTPEQAFQMGFREFLHKPIAPDQLCLAARRALDHASESKPHP